MKKTSLILGIISCVCVGISLLLFLTFIVGSIFGSWIIYNLAGFACFFYNFFALFIAVAGTIACFLEKRFKFAFINLGLVVFLIALFVLVLAIDITVWGFFW
jgi:hypothetical protein